MLTVCRSMSVLVTCVGSLLSRSIELVQMTFYERIIAWARQCLSCKSHTCLQCETPKIDPSYPRNYWCYRCHSDLRWLRHQHHRSKPKVTSRYVTPPWLGGGLNITTFDFLFFLKILLLFFPNFLEFTYSSNGATQKDYDGSKRCFGVRTWLLGAGW